MLSIALTPSIRAPMCVMRAGRAVTQYDYKSPTTSWRSVPGTAWRHLCGAACREMPSGSDIGEDAPY